MIPASRFDLPKIGSRFAGQFDILELIGQGGMGVVYRARQLKLRREVALKVLRPAAVAGGYEQFRLEREAVSAARFRSRHVVDIYDWGVSDDGATYLVMELLHGETLAQRLVGQGTVEPSQVATWVRQCSEALDEASALGIVHRDIKPANLFLATTRSAGATEIKILDFGITKVFDSTRGTAFPHEATTQSSLRMGTTRYMSPEQLRATSSVDARADIWSLGVVVYQTLAGRYPFDRASEADLIVSILSDQPMQLHLVNAKLSPAVSDAVARALEKNPNARYGSAGEFSSALSAALAGHSVGLPAAVRDSTRPAPLNQAPSCPTDAGLETGASHDSLRSEPQRPLHRATKVFAVAGATLTVSSALAVAAILLPASAPSAARATVTATRPAHDRETAQPQSSVQRDHGPSPSESAAKAKANAPAQPPWPAVSGSSAGTPSRRQPMRPTSAAASPARPALSASSTHQFERDNPYAE